MIRKDESNFLMQGKRIRRRFKMNDDLKKDIQSWRYVPASNMAAKLNNFHDLYEMDKYIKDKGAEINLSEVLIPIHFDMLESDEEEGFFFDQERIPKKLNTMILHLHHDYEDENFGEQPEEMNILDFICYEYPVTGTEAFKVLVDLE